MKVICIGDSITVGYGVNTEYSWFELLKNSNDNMFINKGINGDTTFGVLSRYYKDVTLNNPTDVLILVGTNDFLLNRSLKNTMENLLLIINETLENNINPIVGIPMKIEINLASKIWTTDLNYASVNNNLKEYRDFIIDLCNEKNIKYIDFYNTFEEYTKKCAPEELFIDGIHPTELGHKIMFNEVLKYF